MLVIKVILDLHLIEELEMSQMVALNTHVESLRALGGDEEGGKEGLDGAPEGVCKNGIKGYFVENFVALPLHQGPPGGCPQPDAPRL